MCLATRLLEDTSGPAKILFLECLASFPHMPPFGKELGGLRRMFAIVPTSCSKHRVPHSIRVTLQPFSLSLPHTGHVQHLPWPSGDLDHGNAKRYVGCWSRMSIQPSPS